MANLKKLLVAAAFVTTASTAAIAADAGDIRLLGETKINLVQAIEAAQKSQGGQAIDASLDDDSFKPAYEVSVVKDGRVFDVQVDGVTGEVLGSREDIDD